MEEAINKMGLHRASKKVITNYHYKNKKPLFEILLAQNPLLIRPSINNCDLIVVNTFLGVSKVPPCNFLLCIEENIVAYLTSFVVVP